MRSLPRTIALIGLLVGGHVVACASMATGAPLTISNVTGGWTNAQPAPPDVTITNQSGSLLDSLRWGIPDTVKGQSGYDFDPIDGAFDPVLGTPFLLGTFDHINNPI